MLHNVGKLLAAGAVLDMLAVPRSHFASSEGDPGYRGMWYALLHAGAHITTTLAVAKLAFAVIKRMTSSDCG